MERQEIQNKKYSVLQNRNLSKKDFPEQKPQQ